MWTSVSRRVWVSHSGCTGNDRRVILAVPSIFKKGQRAARRVQRDRITARGLSTSQDQCNHPTGPRNAQKDDQAADLGYCWQRAILDQVEQVPRRNTRHPHALRHDIEIQDLLGIANRWLIMIDIRDGGRVDKFLAKARGTCQRRWSRGPRGSVTDQACRRRVPRTQRNDTFNAMLRPRDVWHMCQWWWWWLKRQVGSWMDWQVPWWKNGSPPVVVQRSADTVG